MPRLRASRNTGQRPGTTKRPDGGLQWWYAPGGKATFVELAHDSTPLANLRFGDFNGDGQTDVFRTIPSTSSGIRQWQVSFGGAGGWTDLAYADTKLGDMQFADVDGDGHTDVVTSQPSGTAGTYDWVYSPGGSGSYVTMATQREQSIHDVQWIGNFDDSGDSSAYHSSDAFYTSIRNDGSRLWSYFHWKPTAGNRALSFDATKPANLRFADFNGDGVTDVFKLKRSC